MMIAFIPMQTLMAQCRFALKDDGLFLSALFAGDTLQVSSIIKASKLCKSTASKPGISTASKPDIQ